MRYARKRVSVIVARLMPKRMRERSLVRQAQEQAKEGLTTMGLQKYRADTSDPPDANGAVAYHASCFGGHHTPLALVRNCPIKSDNPELTPRTIYAQGEPDTWFSIPAACTFKRRTITGWLGCEDGQWLFHAHTNQ